jgi:hypothetical protein
MSNKKKVVKVEGKGSLPNLSKPHRASGDTPFSSARKPSK